MKKRGLQNRRHFIGNMVKYATIGTAVFAIPTLAYSRHFYSLDPEPYSFEAYKAEFQEGIEYHKLDGSIERALGVSDYNWKVGEVKYQKSDPEFVSHINDVLSGTSNDVKITSPVSKLQTNKNYDHLSQVIRSRTSKDGEIVTILTQGKGDNEKRLFFVPFCFTVIVEKVDYYCYGVPSSDSAKYTCKNCGEKYFYQEFYYNGKNTLDDIKKYKEATTNFYCDGKGMKCSHSSSGYHNNLELKPTIGCVCSTPQAEKNNSKM